MLRVFRKPLSSKRDDGFSDHVTDLESILENLAQSDRAVSRLRASAVPRLPRTSEAAVESDSNDDVGNGRSSRASVRSIEEAGLALVLRRVVDQVRACRVDRSPSCAGVRAC